MSGGHFSPLDDTEFFIRVLSHEGITNTSCVNVKILIIVSDSEKDRNNKVVFKLLENLYFLC